MKPSSGTDYRALVLQAINIVDLIGQTVALKRRGKNYVGLCPFHKEKTPSFYVDPARQFFNCFGCKAHGNAIDFVIQRDRVEFKEAMMSLGRQAGIDMPKFGADREKTGRRQRLLEAQSSACAFFEKLLSHSEHGAVARAYLRDRGISPESISRFQIGLAPNAWNGLIAGPVGKKYPAAELALAGLAKPNSRGDGFYDTFRDRLMFPIRDEGGRILAFGGRVMPGSDDPAKYLNSPETPLFSKGRCVYGIDLARQRIVETRSVTVVEGYTDVVMAHQFGVANVVSILGTAMTEEHLAILRRFADKIVLLFDADIAGDTAVDRVVALFLHQPVEIAIASMPPGVDPDEYLLAHGAQAFEGVLAEATDALSYKWRQLSRRFISRADDLTGQQKAVEEYLKLLADARGAGPIDPIRWGQALARVNRLTNVPMEELNRRFRVKKTAGRRFPIAGAGEQSQPDSAARPRLPTARDQAERRILGVLLAEPHRWFQVQQQVYVEDFTEQSRQKLAAAYWAYQRDEGEPVFNEFLSHLNDPDLARLAMQVVAEADEWTDRNLAISDAVEYLAKIRRQKQEGKPLAGPDRTTREESPQKAQWDLLAELMKQNKPDLAKIEWVLRRGGK